MKFNDLIEEIELCDVLDSQMIKELKKKYSKLQETHPKLFKKLMEDPNNKENIYRIKRMLKLYDQVISGETTNYNASVVVGQELADQYLGHLPKNSN
jgi:hypothetical protein